MNEMGKEYKLERMNSYAGTQVTERGYNLTIGLTLLWGVLINVVMAYFFTYQILSINYIAVLVIYFVGTLGCSFIVHKSNSPAVSFAGFTGLTETVTLLRKPHSITDSPQRIFLIRPLKNKTSVPIEDESHISSAVPPQFADPPRTHYSMITDCAGPFYLC